MVFSGFWIRSMELTIGAGPPAVIAHITSAVRAVALLAVTAPVPPLHPAVLPLLHLTADVWQQWVRGGKPQATIDRDKHPQQFCSLSVLLWLWAGMYGTCPGDLHLPGSPLGKRRLHRDPGWPWRSARTTRADVSWLCCPAAGNDGRQHSIQTPPSSLHLGSIHTWLGVLCLSFSLEEPFFLWANVSSCLRSNMDLTITSREPMRRDQRLRGRLEGSEVTWQAPCLNRERKGCQRKQSQELDLIIPMAFFIQEIKSVMKLIEFYNSHSHAVCFRMNFTQLFISLSRPSRRAFPLWYSTEDLISCVKPCSVSKTTSVPSQVI